MADERRRQIGLHQGVAFPQRRAVGAGKYLRRGRPARQPPRNAGQRVGHVVGDDKTVARQLDGRLEQVRQREVAGAVFLQRQRQARDGAGHADAERGIARLGDIGLAVGAEEHVARRRGRRGLAIVDRDVLAALRRVDDHEAAAADVSGARIGDGQRKAGRDRGIDRIAALPQDIGAYLRADFLLRDHHAVFGGNGVNCAGAGCSRGAPARRRHAKSDNQRDCGQ